MKRCPVCASVQFDDMSTCYGCLYQFGSDPALEEQRSREIEVAGWVIRVRAEGPGAAQTALTIEIEPTCGPVGSRRGTGTPAPVGFEASEVLCAT